MPVFLPCTFRKLPSWQEIPRVLYHFCCAYAIPTLFALAPYLCIWFLSFAHLQAQTQQEPIPDPDEYVEVEREPTVDLKKLGDNTVYPEIARRAGIEGNVILRVLVGTDGIPKRCNVLLSQSALLDTAAIAAVMQATFTPAMQKGKPIMAWTTIPIIFRLPSSVTLSPTQALLKAIAKRASYGEYDRALHFYNRGLVYYKSDNKEEAQRDFAYAQRIDSLVQWTPYDSISAKEIARIDIRNNNKTEDALAFAKRGELMMEYSINHAIADVSLAIDIDPMCVYAYAQRAKAYYLQGMWDKAESDFLTVQQKQELAPGQNAMLGYCYYETENYPEAIRASNQVIQRQPALPIPHYIIALSLLRMEEDLGNVQEAFEKAKDADNNDEAIRAPFVRVLQQLVTQDIRAEEAQQILREVFHIE